VSGEGAAVAPRDANWGERYRGWPVAHCPPELLDDLADLLAEVGAWAGVAQRKPGVFYLRGQPFLHFHLLEGGRRRGDVKGQTGWVQLDLPRPISAARCRAVLRELRRRYREREQ
jgi:hypothetical protein